ncbi:MAG: corA [Massilia sp.]|nr:corA [Massilia sp.]
MNEVDAKINCSVYRKGFKVTDIGVDDISESLQAADSFVWLGLLEPDEELMRKVQDQLGLHDLAVEDARKAHQRAKLEEYGDVLFVVLYTAKLVVDTIYYGETHIFVGPRFVVTVRHGPSDGYRGVRQRAEKSPERLSGGPGYVLYSIIDFVVDNYQPCMDNLQVRFRQAERELFQPNPPASNIEHFYNLKHELITLQSAALPLTDICTQLLRFHSDIIPRESRIYYRDILDHVALVAQAADRIRQMIDAAMQVALAQITIRQNDIVKRLAGWAAILAVPTMVFSWFGMNFKFMPELEWRWSYPAVLAGIAICSWAIYRRLKREGWL